MFPVFDISRHFLWKPDALPASQRVGRTTLDTVVGDAPQATAAPQPSVPEPSTGPGSPGGLAGPLRAPRATDFLTKGEIMYLFVVPGLPA